MMSVRSAPERDAVSGTALKRKLGTGFRLQIGTRFPGGTSSGNCVPESSLRVGHAFPTGLQTEAVSRIQASEWDELSQRGLKWKLHPGMSSQGGMQFPVEAGAENASQNPDNSVVR